MKKWVLVLHIIISFNAMADCDSSGKCVWDCSPDNKTNTCTATFEKGTLTISGTEMKNYSNKCCDGNSTYITTNAPWNDEAGHLKQITNVVIGSEMKNLGSDFLTSATNLKHITIPDNIMSVGGTAFYHTGLTSVDWPSSLKTIPSSTFQYTHLTDLSVFDGVTTIDSAAFHGVFIGSKSPTSIVIPDTVTKIGMDAFTGNAQLQSVIMSDKITNIDSNAFDSRITTIYCTGNLETCKANVGEAFADKVKQASKKEINGVSYIYDKSGKLIITSGNRKEKRIYTIDEANQVAGKINTFKIKYR